MKLRHLARVLLYPFSPFRELKRPRTPVDRDLLSKQLRAAQKRPVNSIRRVIGR